MRKQCIQQGDREVHVRQLEGMGEAIWYMRHAEEQQKESGMSGASLREGDSDWYGTASMDEAIEFARFGWEEGRRTLLRRVGHVAVSELVGRRLAVDPVSSYSGDEVDIDNFLMRRPDHMVEYPLRYDVGGKQATVLMNCSIAAGVSAERIMRRGAAVLAAIEALRTDGYSLGLTMMEASRSSSSRTTVEYYIPVVHPGGFLDMDAVAFCVAHPSFLRRLIFALNEHEPVGLRRTMGFSGGEGYGWPARIASGLPPHSFVIEQGEGLDLEDDAAVQKFAQGVADRAIAVLER